jgi:hypothetical protein
MTSMSIVRRAVPGSAGLLLAALLALTPSPAPAEIVHVSSAVDAQPGFALTAQDPGGIEMRYAIDWFRMDPVVVEGQAMQVVTLPGAGLPNNAGAPNLPGQGRFIAVPQGATAAYEITYQETRIYQDVEIAPAPPLPVDSEDAPLVYEMDLGIYSVNAYYPASPVQVSEPRKLRGVDVVMLGITPFQYNPVSKELVVYTQLEVRVDFQGGNGQFGENRLRSRYWEPILRDQLVNYEALPPAEFSLARAGREGYEYVIITPDDADFVAWGDSIKAWRQLQGITTEVFTVADIGGTSWLAIEAWLDNAYDTWDPAPAAFLILGDYIAGDGKGGTREVGVTAPEYQSYCISDNMYADVDGDDLPDMAHGRICARDAGELATMIGKMLDYERQPVTDPGFYDAPLITGGWQTDRWFILCAETIRGHQTNVLGKNPPREYAIYSGTPDTIWSDNQNTHMIVDYFGPEGLGYIPANLPPELTWDGDAAGINSHINSGAYFVLHRDHGAVTGWGEPHYVNSDLDALTTDQPPFVFSLNCETGRFNWTSESFAEKFHRLSNGALGIIAATENSFSFVNDALAWGTFDAIWHDFDPLYGDSAGLSPRTAFALASGKYYLEASNWPFNPYDKDVTYHLFHHHGDAFMSLYSEVPQPLTVLHDSHCITDTASFFVQADSGAIVALTVDGAIVGLSEANGLLQEVAIIPQGQPGELRITATLPNYLRYDVTVPVIPPEGPYMLVAGHTVDDDTTGQSRGNEDGGANAGETVDLIVSLTNVGTATATNVIASLATSDPYAELLDAGDSFGTVLPESTAVCLESYRVAIDNECPDGHTIVFDVLISSDEELEWEKSLSLPVSAPVISLAGYTIDDALGGNGNGRCDPGESFFLTPQLGNAGGQAATNLALYLSIHHPDITILQGTATIESLRVGEEAAPPSAFEVSIDASTADPNLLHGMLVVNADWGQNASPAFDMPVGGFFDDFEAETHEWLTYLLDPGFVNEWHRTETRNFTPGGGWSWAFNDSATSLYADLADGVLVTDTLVLADQNFLRFRHWMDAETSGAYPGYCYDGGMVEISVNGGGWTQITPEGGYPYLIRDGSIPGPWPAGTPVFSGDIDWELVTFDVSSYLGKAQFRFRFGSDGAINGEGWYLDDIELIGYASDPSAADEQTPLALHPAVMQNRPNPFGPETAIIYQLPESGPVRLQIFDPTGRLVRTLINGVSDGGQHLIRWNGADERGAGVASGVYFYRFEAGGVTQTKKMVLSR